MGGNREFSQRFHFRLDAQGSVPGDHQIAGDIHHRFRVHEIALLIVKVEGGPARRDGCMIGGGARPARPGGHIHKNEIGGGAAPIGEMRKIQDRFLASASRPGYRHHRQRGEDAVARIQLHRDSGEQTLGAVQRTDPTKSDISVAVNTSSMYRASCPLASRSISTASSTMPPLINRQLTVIASSPRLWSAAAVRIPPAWRRAGKRASLTGGLIPTPATPMSGRPKRRTPPMGPFENTFTDPVTTSPWPWVEIVSSPSGSIAVRTLRLPSSVISRSSVTSTTVSAAIGLPSLS